LHKRRLTPLISGYYVDFSGEKFIEKPRFSDFFFIFATADFAAIEDTRQRPVKNFNQRAAAPMCSPTTRP